MFVYSVVASLLLTAVAILAHRGRISGVMMAILAFLFVLLLPWGTVTGFVFVLLSVAVIGCRLAKMAPSRFVWVACACTAATYVGAVVIHIPRYRQHRELLAAAGSVDVDARLAYEMTHPDASREAIGGGFGAVHSLREVEQAFLSDSRDGAWQRALAAGTRFEQSHVRKRFLQALARTHEGFVADFVESPGFGVGRMGYRYRQTVTNSDIELPPPPALPLPKPAESKYPEEADEMPLANEPAELVTGATPQNAELTRLHAAGLLDFVNPEGFGYVKTRKEAIGFQSHGFREVPPTRAAEDGTKWQVVQLELVSLLKHSPPAAYVSKHLPRMDELRDAPTRALVAFEIEALAKLRVGEELVVESTADEIRMLGPLRAFDECRQCHQVKEGALLGAFTYWLRPVGAGLKKGEPAPGRPVL